MEKTSQKITKDPKRVEAARKCRENYMNKLKESILNDERKVAEILAMQAMKLPALQTLPPPPANSTTNIDTSDNYIYGVGILAVLAIGVCVFFAYNTSQAANK